MNDASGSFARDGFITATRAPTPVGPEISVVMVVYQTGEVLTDSIVRVLSDPDVDELVLIDNGSSPAEKAVMDKAACADQRVTVIRGQGNVGFARAANIGAKAAHGHILVVLNPDAFLQEGCIAALRAALKDQASPCLVGARIMNHDGSEQRGARRGEVTPVTSLLSLTNLSRAFGGLKGFEIHHENDPAPKRRIQVPTISGACFAIRRYDFFALGGFDTGYFLHVEDVDLCWRVRQAGGTVLFEPRARVMHLGSTSLKSPLKVEFWKGVGLARYFRKRADNIARLALAVAITPLIIAVSVIRPVLRGQALKKRGGLRFRGR
jgi:N-acetylglucosaminyl-diphospho-decaprenol L-rhamnosyltransferase